MRDRPLVARHRCGWARTIAGDASRTFILRRMDGTMDPFA
ncbi:Hypothetical protein A7982_06956 [Minicystis rosea]|nr:Hypothetical protein A7982_06956 [Minicystis rosea]